MFRRAVRFALPVLLASPLAAQSYPLVGTWAIELPAGARIENGIATPIMAKGSLAISAVGDSLVGTLTVEPPAGAPARPPARLATRAGAGPAVFVQKSTAKLNVNGEESTRDVTSTYRVEAVGDSLKGTVDRTIEGMDDAMGGPQPFGGRRVKPTG